MISAGFRTNEALCQLSYEAPYLGPECGTLPQTINSIIMSGIAQKQDAFKYKIAPHKQKSIVPLIIGALCLSTPKHNGKSGTGYDDKKKKKKYHIVRTTLKYNRKSQKRMQKIYTLNTLTIEDMTFCMFMRHHVSRSQNFRSMTFVLVLQNHPIRTLYQIQSSDWLFCE